MQELISIIVPVYNVEKYLNKCVDSILDQTYTNFELILIDDGSPDNCGKICDEYSKKDKRVRVIHKENKGLSDSRNIGMMNAKGKYINFVDSDDYLNKNMIKDLYNLLIKNNADISICAYELLNENEKPKLKLNGKEHIFSSSEAIQELLMSKILTSHCWNKLYKRELWKEIQFPVGKKFEDIAVMHLVFEKARKIVYKNKVEYYYLRRNDSIMKTIDEKLVNDLRENSINRKQYIETNFPQLKDYVEISEIKRIKMCYDNIILGNLKNLYNSKDYIADYKKFKEYMKKHKKVAINAQGNIRKKIELIVFNLNRNLYRYIVLILTKIR